MKLLTHNMLTSKCLKGVTIGYPLDLIAKEVKVQESEINRDFIKKMIPKLDWHVFWNAAKQLGHEGSLPQQLVDNHEQDEKFLQDVHHALVEVDIFEGELVCPETKRKFPIREGIPNMLVKDDEL